jgi:hypothetical protein
MLDSDNEPRPCRPSPAHADPQRLRGDREGQPAAATASTADAPAGVHPDVAVITYYAPCGNLAIFDRDFGYAAGLVRLGSVESGTEALAGMSGDFTVTIEHAG